MVNATSGAVMVRGLILVMVDWCISRLPEGQSDWILGSMTKAEGHLPLNHVHWAISTLVLMDG